MILRHDFAPLDNQRLAHLCGSLDGHLRDIEAAFNVSIRRRNEAFRIEGLKAGAEKAVEVLMALYERAQRPIPAEALQLALVSAERGDAPVAEDETVVLRTRRSDLAGRPANQRGYLQQILTHDISFGIGPAGTGKTFLAVACAVDALERSTVQRIILTRPAVEAGEHLGFCRVICRRRWTRICARSMTRLYDLMGMEKVTRAFEKGTIEVAPLAFMRGRTLNHAFVILDEAQTHRLSR